MILKHWKCILPKLNKDFLNFDLHFRPEMIIIEYGR